MTEVRDLLAASRAAHLRYRQLHSQSKNSNLEAQGQAVQDALSKRIEAQALDPEHLDSAWLSDQSANKGVSSEAMVEFLGRYLTPVEARA